MGEHRRLGERKPDTTIFGGPTKRFFVSMLPRDIELEDALLDLLDNCIDGAMRQERSRLDRKTPFLKYHAELTLSSKGFEIADNCGGIPKDYVEGAFFLGRPSLDQDSDLPTIGMYGIGMKRAIFKIGNEARVQSNSKDGYFEVEYSKKWLDPENTVWDLPIVRAQPKKDAFGVKIAIRDVKKDIGKKFDQSFFVNTLKAEISEHFGYLIQRGFAISVNGERLAPKILRLKFKEFSKEKTISPFDYEDEIDEVKIKIIVGFFRNLAKESEIDAELENPLEKEIAGVSVVCNDRVILLADRTMKTGWGDGGVPKYHPQFRSIAGLVVFSSAKAEKLPIETTKRDLEMSSEVYLKARKVLMEGLQIFTGFTNKWKGMEKEADKFFEISKADAKTEVKLAEKHGSKVRNEPAARKYVPNLPYPEVRDPRRRVSFVKPESEIRTVSEFLFDEPNRYPSDVGEECFARFLREAKKK